MLFVVVGKYVKLLDCKTPHFFVFFGGGGWGEGHGGGMQKMTLFLHTTHLLRKVNSSISQSLISQCTCTLLHQRI